MTVNALLRYLSEQAPSLTERFHGGRQDVVQFSTGQDFPIVVGTSGRGSDLRTAP